MWNIIKWYQTVLFCLFLACSKPTDDGGVTVTRPPEQLFGPRWASANCTEPDTISTWSRDLGADFILYHTAGLRSMALSGSVSSLNQEYCGIGELGHLIPSNLGDDIEGVGYASVITFNNWRIAMYHPTQAYPDNWIMYNPVLNYWERYDLGHDENGPITLHSKRQL